MLEFVSLKGYEIHDPMKANMSHGILKSQSLNDVFN